MSRNVIRGKVQAAPFERAVHPLSELPPPEQRGRGKIADVIRRQKEELRKAAYDAGYSEGFEQGRAEGREHALAEANARYAEEIARFVVHLQAIEQRIDMELEAWLEATEQSLAALGVSIAERILRAELEHTRESTIAIAKEALAEVRHGTQARIRVNPFDEGLVEARREEILAGATGLRAIEVVADPAIQGGCIVEGDGGIIDARVEAALDRIVSAAREEAA